MLKIADDVVARRLDDEVVLVHLATNRIYALNPTGARFWELLAEGVERPEIVRRLCAEFAVEPDEVEREVSALSAELSKAGLVTSDGGA